MEEKEVSNQEKVNDGNDNNKFEEVEPIKKKIRTDSYFDGGLIELIGWNLLSILLSVITFGIAAPWCTCMLYSYQINHTVYNGKRLKFEGTGGDLFVNIFKWVLLSIITFGIYILFVPVKKTKWVISNIHFEDENLVRDESFFDGKTIQLIGVNILSFILNFISLGLLYPFTVCFKLRWINKHTIINRKRLIFKGRAISLFGHYILWCILTIITFGIYGLWLSIKMLQWQTKYTHIKVVGEEEQNDKSLYIAIPLLIVGIILFGLIVPKLFTTIGNIGGTDNFNIEETFEDFGNLFNLNKGGSSSSDKVAVAIDPNMPIDNTNENVEIPTDNILAGDYSEISGTYIEVLGAYETLYLDENGVVTMSGRVVTNSLASIVKQSDGSYSCPIEGGEIIIYPVGVSNSQGDINKVRIDVIEYMGAICFQKQ